MTDQSIHQDEEIWKPVSGFEDLYLISNMGNVFSTRSNRNLVPKKCTNGYVHVALCRGVKTYRMIHKLVANEFLGGSGDVNHLDGDRKNNKLSNLEMTSRRENISHGAGSKRRSIGASYNKRQGVWRSFIRVNGKQLYLGRFPTEELAAQAYKEALVKYGLENRYS